MVTGPSPLARSAQVYRDHLTVERGLAPNSLAAYSRDLRRYLEAEGFVSVSWRGLPAEPAAKGPALFAAAARAPGGPQRRGGSSNERRRKR